MFQHTHKNTYLINQVCSASGAETVLVHTDVNGRVKEAIETDGAFQVLLHFLVPYWKVLISSSLGHCVGYDS